MIVVEMLSMVIWFYCNKNSGCGVWLMLLLRLQTPLLMLVLLE